MKLLFSGAMTKKEDIREDVSLNNESFKMLTLSSSDLWELQITISSA